MAVFEDGKVIPGTERKSTSRATVLRRRENRRLWKQAGKEAEKASVLGHSGIYGWRKAGWRK